MQPNAPSERRTIKLDYLTRVEGEASLRLSLDHDRVANLELRIFEPPRFFEALLRGRSGLEAPDITARICGICPVAYQLTAALAVERALGIEVDPQIVKLRRVLYAGEWIQSHALHILMLHAPDFLGFDDVASMAKVHGARVQSGLAMRRAGNEIIKLLGGREIHPINVRVGGFYKLPSSKDLANLHTKITEAIDIAVDCARWTAGFDFPDISRHFSYLSLRQEAKYPLFGDHLTFGDGDDFSVEDFESRIKEEQVSYSNSLQATDQGGGLRRIYLTGPVARFHLFRRHFNPIAAELADALLGTNQSTNPFASIVIRAIEIVHSLEEAKNILNEIEMPLAPCEQVSLRSGDGCAVTEAPRGVLYHRYRLNRSGDILAATIIPPTSQNQCAIEEDVRTLVNENPGLDDHSLSTLCERAIRNYDPCISCAAHFLKVERLHSRS